MVFFLIFSSILIHSSRHLVPCTRSRLHSWHSMHSIRTKNTWRGCVRPSFKRRNFGFLEKTHNEWWMLFHLVYRNHFFLRFSSIVRVTWSHALALKKWNHLYGYSHTWKKRVDIVSRVFRREMYGYIPVFARAFDWSASCSKMAVFISRWCCSRGVFFQFSLFYILIVFGKNETIYTGTPTLEKRVDICLYFPPLLQLPST